MFKASRVFSFRVSAKSNGRIRFTALGRTSIALEHNRPVKQVWNFAG